MKGRNCTLDFLKLYFSLFIVLFHFYEPTHEHFESGMIAVDAFAIMSGLFFFQGVAKEGEPCEFEPYSYIRKRFKRFFPYVLVAYIFAFVVQYFHILSISNAQELEQVLLNGLSEISVIDIFMLAFGRWPLNAPAWTISLIFLVECIMYCCQWYSKRLFEGIILPISFIVACVIYARYDISAIGDNLFRIEVCRIWIDISLGLLCLQISNKIRKIQTNKLRRITITGVELFFHLGFLILACGKTQGYYWISIMILPVIISIAHSQTSYVEVLLEKIRITPHLAVLSLGIYLTHWTILKCYLNKYPMPYEMYIHKFEFMVMVFVVAIFYCLLIRLILKCKNELRLEIGTGESKKAVNKEERQEIIERKAGRVGYFDILNILAAICVVWIHFGNGFHGYSDTIEWRWCLFIQVICFWAVPVFFMLTGATLMGYPSKYSTKEFFRRRIKKTLIPYLLFGVVALFFYQSRGGVQINWEHPVLSFLDIFMNNRMESVYWFLPILFGIYVVMPALSVFARPENRKQLDYLVFTGVLTISVFPFLARVFQQFWGVSEYCWNDVFFLPMLGGYLIYPVLGYWAATHDFSRRERVFCYLAGLGGFTLRFFGLRFLCERDGIICTEKAATLDFSGVAAIFVTN